MNHSESNTNQLLREGSLLLEHFLIQSGDTSSFGVPCETKDKNHVDIAFLDAYATKQWETILHFLVGTEMPEEPGGGVLTLLMESGLMEGNPS
jgi:transcription initiation factor TFIIH subunit 4